MMRYPHSKFIPMIHPIRVGIIGHGYATKTFHAPLIASVPGLVLSAISSSDPSKVRADWPSLKVFDTPQALIEHDDIDLVIVPTPNDTHFPLARDALQAGKHAVVDKPFTLTRDEADQLGELAAQGRRILSVFHNRRWDGDFLTVRDVIQSGVLGRITHVESHFDRFRPNVRGRWREQPGPGGGLWLDLGSHLVDQAMQLFGPPAGLSVDLMTQREGAVNNDGFHALLRYADGLRVVLHASALTGAPGARFALHGTHGSFVKWGLDPQESALKTGQRPDGVSRWDLPPETASLHLQDPASPDDLIASTMPAANPVSAEQAAQVMSLLELGAASHESRREMPLPA